jgi:hypothetical protein
MEPGRREVLLEVPEHLILDVLNGRIGARTDLPPDAVFFGCHYDFARAAFLIRVSHPSFQPVPPYCEARRYPLRLIKVAGGYEEVARPNTSQHLTREVVMAVLNKNFKEADVALTARRYNEILTDLGFPLD